MQNYVNALLNHKQYFKKKRKTNIYHQAACYPTHKKVMILLNTGELGYEGPLYNRFLHMTHNMFQSDAYQVFVICIRQILLMTYQFSWSH